MPKGLAVAAVAPPGVGEVAAQFPAPVPDVFGAQLEAVAEGVDVAREGVCRQVIEQRAVRFDENIIVDAVGEGRSIDAQAFAGIGRADVKLEALFGPYVAVAVPFPEVWRALGVT